MEHSDISELDVVISELDRQLINGYYQHAELLKDYRKELENDPASLAQYVQNKRQSVDEWKQRILDILNQKLKRKYHAFHFAKPKIPAGRTLLGVPSDLSNLSINFEYSLYALEDIVIRLEEEKNFSVRREIAEREYQADILYKVTYSNHTREIRLNSIVLTKTDFNSENDNFFNFVYANPGRPIGIDELSSHMGGPPNKRLSHIVRDLGFVGDLRQIFFPVVTKTEVMFVNPITRQYAFQNHLPPLNFTALGRQRKIEEGLVSQEAKKEAENDKS